MSDPVPSLLLAALGVGVLAGCTAGDTPDPTPPTPRAAHPDADAIVAAIAREEALRAGYDAAPGLGAALSGLMVEARGHHDAHLAALRAAAGRLGVELGSPSASAVSSSSPVASPTTSNPTTSSSAGTTPTAAPASPDDVAVARRLLAAEQSSAGAGIAAVHDVTDAALRVTLAQVAASESQHAAALHVGIREGVISRMGPRAGTPTQVAPS